VGPGIVALVLTYSATHIINYKHAHLDTRIYYVQAQRKHIPNDKIIRSSSISTDLGDAKNATLRRLIENWKL
jgi:hypothetical protein